MSNPDYVPLDLDDFAESDEGASIIDSVMKAIMIRLCARLGSGKAAVFVTWEEIEAVNRLQCEILRTDDGLVLRTSNSSRN